MHLTSDTSTIPSHFSVTLHIIPETIYLSMVEKGNPVGLLEYDDRRLKLEKARVISSYYLNVLYPYLAGYLIGQLRSLDVRLRLQYTQRPRTPSLCMSTTLHHVNTEFDSGSRNLPHERSRVTSISGCSRRC